MLRKTIGRDRGNRRRKGWRKGEREEKGEGRRKAGEPGRMKNAEER